MANYNSTTKYDSSGSDDADGTQGNVPTEIHYKKECGQRRFRLKTTGGSYVYVWLRSCVCRAQYKSFNIHKGVKDLKEEEGKDVHYSAECRWRKTKKETMVEESWEWKQKCLGCTRPQTAAPSYTGNYNQTWAGIPTKFR